MYKYGKNVAELVERLRSEGYFSAPEQLPPWLREHPLAQNLLIYNPDGGQELHWEPRKFYDPATIITIELDRDYRLEIETPHNKIIDGEPDTALLFLTQIDAAGFNAEMDKFGEELDSDLDVKMQEIMEHIHEEYDNDDDNNNDNDDNNDNDNDDNNDNDNDEEILAEALAEARQMVARETAIRDKYTRGFLIAVADNATALLAALPRIREMILQEQLPSSNLQELNAKKGPIEGSPEDKQQRQENLQKRRENRKRGKPEE